MGRGETFKFISHLHRPFSALLLIGTVSLNAYLINSTKPFDKRTSFTEVYLVTPSFAKWLSAGYWPVVVDYLWLNLISEIGTAEFTDPAFKRSHASYDLGIRLDPNFYELYEQAAVLFSFFYENAETSLEFLNRGIQRYESGLAPSRFWTHPVTLYIHRAYVYAFIANDWQKARAAYLEAARIPGAPSYLRHAQAWMVSEDSERILAIRVLKILIRNTSDEKLKKKYQEKLSKYEP